MIWGWTNSEILQAIVAVGWVISSIIGLIAVRMVRNVHIMINSRMSQMIEGAKAQGIVSERDAADARVVAKSITDIAHDEAIKR